jgi:diaminopimelate decarboxylase
MPFPKSYLSKEEMSNAFIRAIHNRNVIGQEDTSILFYDMTFLLERIRNLRALFPESTLHAIAVKANPLIKILLEIKNLNVGLEVASGPELFMAEKVGFPADRIVFDSPAKTPEEIEYALKQGIHLNADSFEELERIDKLLESIKSTSTIGVRINPQVGAGSIKSTSVADSISKFGIPMNENSERLKECYLKYHWLKGIHVHIGSQGCPVPLLVGGIKKVLDFALEINGSLTKKSSNKRIEIFDIGGGLPVSYFVDKPAASMEDYVNLLKLNLPELFSGDFKIVTEFGRYIHANAGWAASRVEYVKREKDYNIIMTHLGADFLLRKCYNPDDWHHQITVVDSKGQLKTGKDKNRYIIAGPLCFAGDVIATDLEFPKVESGDYVLIHDVGAYTLSMWSRYNSRQMPKVVGYYSDSKEFQILKNREGLEDIFVFWK